MSSNRLVTWRAISGLRITDPSSLLMRAERPSMLSDPMKTVFSSITSAFACRLAFELRNG